MAGKKKRADKKPKSDKKLKHAKLKPRKLVGQGPKLSSDLKLFSNLDLTGTAPTAVKQMHAETREDEAVIGATDRPEQRTCVLILGMHRSGTSALTRVLSFLGARLPQTIKGPFQGNVTGHWESDKLVQIHDALLAELGSVWHDWRPLDISRLSAGRREDLKRQILSAIDAEFEQSEMFTIKDPRINRFAEFYIDLLVQSGFNVIPVLPVRNPMEVAASLLRRTQAWPKHASDIDATLLWLGHVLDAEWATRNLSRAIISFDGLFKDWSKTTSSIIAQTALPVALSPHEAAPLVDEFLRGDLRHHDHTISEVQLHPVLSGWASDTFEALTVLQNSPNAQGPLAVLDRVRSELKHATPFIEHYQAQAGNERQESRSALTRFEHDIKKLQSDLTAEIGKSGSLAAQLLDARNDITNFAANKNSLSQKLARGERAFNAKIQEQRDAIALLKIQRDIERIRLAGERRNTTRWQKLALLRKFSLFNIVTKLLDFRREKMDRQALLQTELFDEDWYLSSNPDIAEKRMDPATHYLRFGAYEGRQPSTRFDGNAYLSVYMDVRDAGLNPLIHYLRHGKSEGRHAHPPITK